MSKFLDENGLTVVKEHLDNKVDKISGKQLSTEDFTSAEKTKLSGIESGAQVNVQSDWNASSGDAQILNKPTLGSAATKNVGTSEGNVPVLDSNGKLDSSILPAIAVSETFTAASEAAMLALNAQVGDVCIRTDETKTYILANTPASTLSNWKLLEHPADAVLSVAGKTGVVTLVKGDVGLGNVDNTSDLDKPVSTATQTALDAKQATLVSGTNIKTINNETILGSGNIQITAGVSSVNGETGAVSIGLESSATSSTGAIQYVEVASFVDGTLNLTTKYLKLQ